MEYINHCWKCGQIVSSKNTIRCRICGWYICPSCDSCNPNCTHFDSEGFDRNWYDKDGYHKNGYNKRGFNRQKLHISGSLYDNNGFNFYGFNKDGYNRKGFDRFGYNCKGYDIDGYDKNGFDALGYNKNGFDKFGKHKNGTNFDDHGKTFDGKTRFQIKNQMFSEGKWIKYKNKNTYKKGKIIKREGKKVFISFYNHSPLMYDLEILINKDLITLI